MYQIHTVLENCLKKKNRIILFLFPKLLLKCCMSSYSSPPFPFLLAFCSPGCSPSECDQQGKRCQGYQQAQRQPCTKYSLAYAKQGPKQRKPQVLTKGCWVLLFCLFVCFLLCFCFCFVFSTVLLLIGRHVRFTCPTKVHILVQAWVSDQSNSKQSFFTQAALPGILQNAVILWLD